MGFARKNTNGPISGLMRPRPLASDKAYQGLQGPSGSTKGLSITKHTHTCVLLVEID